MSDEDHTVPTSADGYKAVVHNHPTATVDVADPRYKSAAAAAHKAGLSQHQFSQMLGFEASRVVAAQAKAAPAATATAERPRKTIPGYGQMSMRERLIASGNI